MVDNLEDGGRRRQPLLPIAMMLAFVLGASIAAWFIFSDDLRQWSRQETLSWSLVEGQDLVLVQQRRETFTASGLPEVLVDAELTWSLRPETTATLPGRDVRITWTLREARVEVREDDAVLHTGLLGAPDDEDDQEGPLTPPPGPEWLSLLQALVGLPLVAEASRDGHQATAVPPDETLEALAERLPTPEPSDGEETEEARADLQASLDLLLSDAQADLAPVLEPELRRPGGTWSRDLRLLVGSWGETRVRIDARLARYEGTLALVDGTYQRRPQEGEALAPGDDALSGLRGAGTFQFDLTRDRPRAGRTTYDARGKIAGRFASLAVQRAWAVGVDAPPEIPAAFRLSPLPPSEEPDDGE